MIASVVELIKQPVCLPPPMVFGLRELCLSIVAVQIRIQSIVAVALNRSIRIRMHAHIKSKRSHAHNALDSTLSTQPPLTDIDGCCADNHQHLRRETRSDASGSSAGRKSAHKPMYV